MLDYTYTNLVLMIGGQLLFIILGVLVITFGLSADFPSDLASKLLGAPSNPNTSSTPGPTMAELPKITPVNNIKRAAVAAVSVLGK
jgi:hypothetical protein